MGKKETLEIVTEDIRVNSETHTNISIEELQLSVRSYNCLKRAQINSISDLLKYSPEKLQEIKNFGQKSADEVFNALKNKVQKIYYRHSGRPGGMKTETLKALRNRIPERILEKSIKGMLPKGPLGRKTFTRLKVFAGPNHLHQAQNPQLITI